MPCADFYRRVQSVQEKHITINDTLVKKRFLCNIDKIIKKIPFIIAPLRAGVHLKGIAVYDRSKHIDNQQKKESNAMKKMLFIAGIAICLSVGCPTGYTGAGDQGAKEEAVAMVKKAIEYIKANGNEKAFEEFSDLKGKFIDRDLYVVVYDMNAKCLAHGQKKSMVGKELIDLKDTDGKEYMKERVELMKKQNSAWQDYKFMNPVSKQIEPKSMYLERHGDLIVGCGIYKK
jgi:uncharacterized protein YrzB (UPF0473 family)